MTDKEAETKSHVDEVRAYADEHSTVLGSIRPKGYVSKQAEREATEFIQSVRKFREAITDAIEEFKAEIVEPEPEVVEPEPEIVEELIEEEVVTEKEGKIAAIERMLRELKGE